MKKMRRARYGARVQNFHALFKCANFLKSPCVHQPGSSLNFVLLGFYGDFITEAWLIKSSAYGSQFNLQLLSPPQRWESRGRRETESFNPSVTFLATSSHPQVLSKGHFMNVNPGVVERGWICYEYQHYIVLITLETPRILGALCQKLGQRPNIYFLL